MERMLLKGLIFIAGTWLIWNSSRDVKELAQNSVKDSRPVIETAKAAKPDETKQDETSAKEPKGTFYMKVHKD